MPSKSTATNILFFILALGLLFGASYLIQTRYFPARPPFSVAARDLTTPLEGADLPDLRRRHLGDLSQRLAGTAALTGLPTLGGDARLMTDVWLAQYLAARNYRLPTLPKPELAKQETKVEAKVQPVKPPPPAPAKPAAKHRVVAIGGEGFKLSAVLTSQGAGVQDVILTQFPAADRMGRPEVDEDGKPVPLHLVPPEFNTKDPSNLLFHYAQPDDDFADRHGPDETLGKIDWQLESVNKQVRENGDHQEVTFATDVPGQDVRIRKIFTLWPDEYHIGLRVEIQRKSDSTEPLRFRYQLTSGHALPIEGVWYTNIFRNAITGRLGERDNFYRDLVDSGTIAHRAGGDKILKLPNERIQYAGIAVQYFASLVVVTDRIAADGVEAPARQDFLVWARPTVESEPDPHMPKLDDIVMRVITEPQSVKETVVNKYLLYYGPVKPRLLADVASGSQGVPPAVVERYHSLHLNKLTDTGGWGWWSDLIIMLTNVMHSVLGFLYRAIGNYGICIILLTLLVRALMHPISRKQARTTMKMQALMPEMKKIQELHKGDRAELGKAQMELYRKHGVHPLGSCWIVFLQMPIFMGLYFCLQESIHFRLSSFLWVKNLAAPDMLIWWGENIPIISKPENMGSFLYLGPYFNLLPIVAVTLTMLTQKYLMPPPADEQAEMTQKMMKYMMIFMGLMFYKVAAGLCIYFIVSSVWGLAERKLLPKAKPAGSAPAAAGLDKPAVNGQNRSAARTKQRTARPTEDNGLLGKMRKMWAELLESAKKK